MTHHQAQGPTCPECGAELIGDEELDPGICLPCQRGQGRAVELVPAGQWVATPPDIRHDLEELGREIRHELRPPPSAPDLVTCPECDGAKGAIIVTLADGETWRDCGTCRGRGTLKV